MSIGLEATKHTSYVALFDLTSVGYLFWCDRPPLGLGLLIHEVCRITHNGAPQ
jgi:hypothetical protein